MNGADALCETLLAGGIDVCFANPGTSEMHFVAALDRQPRMRCVLGLFEGVVTGMADGYARMAERPAATLLHLGPGLANGLANLHNARRARSPMVNVVGDHATYHRAHDAPLHSDIESLARPMSHWIGWAETPDSVSQTAADAIAAARTPPGRIATLVLPADAAWGETAAPLAAAPPPAAAPAVGREAIAAAAQALRGKGALLLLGGAVLRGPALDCAGRIAAATGARLMAQQSNARIERGAGRVPVSRVPYVVEHALAALAGVGTLILVGAKAPVAFFAYPGKPGTLAPPEARILTLAEPGEDGAGALAALAEELGVAAGLDPGRAGLARPAPPTGALTPEAVALAVAALMPEHAVICDESVSSGRDFFRHTATAPPHDFLQITGGAIGCGPPLATGAAIACPGRKVIALQADGSALYTAQALWTQARESLDVTTIIFSNRRYAILYGELKNVGAGDPGRNARRMLDLDDPPIGWVRLAEGFGVPATRVEDADALVRALAAALAGRGPHLIEAVL
ncbi:MAG: acetolactate synthase large subunit [Methylobacteriaceae bacterium]|nr:acetolactate synthase large subunit [Methylobacteriaceae bacterium]